MIAAAVSGGKAITPTIAEMKYDQTVSGSRIIDIPGARRQQIVAIKFSPPIVKDAIKRAMLSSHTVCPNPEPGPAELTALSGG
jgi:hypothetical protein